MTAPFHGKPPPTTAEPKADQEQLNTLFQTNNKHGMTASQFPASFGVPLFLHADFMSALVQEASVNTRAMDIEQPRSRSTLGISASFEHPGVDVLIRMP